MDRLSDNYRPTLAPVAGVKRPAPAPLLPAFDPVPSSPSLPRATKRLHRASSAGQEETVYRYPTPIPTSSTGMAPSSPHLPVLRPDLQRTQSIVSERAPLASVPAIELPESGEPVLIGRSSQFCQHVLSGSRLISRVHVQATYVKSSAENEMSKVEVRCLGCNGIKVHCQGQVWRLLEQETFTAYKDQNILLDVQDVRVLLTWPSQEQDASFTSHRPATPEIEDSPSPPASPNPFHMPSSPTLPNRHLPSPESLSPAGHADPATSSTLMLSEDALADNVVTIYEDGQSSDEHANDGTAERARSPLPTRRTPEPAVNPSLASLSSSPLSDLSDLFNEDEENDPLIVSFGPQGDNLLPRMASITTASVAAPPAGVGVREPSTRRIISPGPRRSSRARRANKPDTSALSNHVINQLAFSRLSSSPLSAIFSNLTASLLADYSSQSGAGAFTCQDLERLLESLAPVGIITREGKDARGKPLENEYYYVPELDLDKSRKEAVLNQLQKPGLRACRKQHKQYFWRKPKTP